jgi:hypothetical protein
VDWVGKDGYDTTGVVIDVHEGIAINSVFAFPTDGEPSFGLLEVNFFRLAVRGQTCRQMIFRIEQPGIPRVGREQCERVNRHPASIVLGSTALDVTDFVGEPEILGLNVPLAQSPFDGFPPHGFPPPSVE